MLDSLISNHQENGIGRSKMEKRVWCHYPHTTAFITLDGLVRPCCFGAIIGDLHNFSLKEIWNSDQAILTRQQLVAGNMDAAGCSNCGFYKRRDIETFPNIVGLGQHKSVSENIERQKQEYQHGVGKVTSFPSHAVIQVTEACNFECTMCFQAHKPEFLEDEILDGVVSESDLFDEIQFTGGEPFVSKWVQKFLRNFDTSRGTKLSFTTNGSLLHRFKDELCRLPRLHLGLSIDGCTKETFERIRKGSNWDEVKANVEWFAGERKKRKPGWETSRLAFVIMRSNYEEIPEFVEWASKLEMPVLFCPVWGDFAEDENIYDHPELRTGLTPASEIFQKAEKFALHMPKHEREETIKSLKYSLEKLQ